MTTLYEDLGVSPDASYEDIRKAYRSLAREHHPDRQGGDNKKFQVIEQAHRILENAETRREYDETGKVVNVLPLESQATESLCMMFNSILANAPAFHELDIKAELQKLVNKSEIDALAAIKNNEEKTSKFNFVLAKLTKSDGSAGPLHVALQSHITALARGTTAAQKYLEVVVEMKRQLGGYEYAYVPPPVAPEITRYFTMGERITGFGDLR